MHIHKFAKRIATLAHTPEAVQTIVDALVAWFATQQVTRKDIVHLVQELRAMGVQKPQLRAPKADLLPQHEKYEFIATEAVWLEVIEWDMRYKRTFLWDVDKLLQ